MQGLGFSGIESPNMVRNSTMPWDYSGFRVYGFGFRVRFGIQGLFWGLGFASGVQDFRCPQR